MKTIFFYATLLLLNIGCKGQQTDSITQENNHNMKRFDTKKFEEKKNKNSVYSFTNHNGDLVKQFQITGDTDYQEITKLKDSRIEIQKRYYADGSLKGVGKQYRERFIMGITKFYDQNGNQEKSVDHDEPFKFTWEQVEAYIKEKNIPECDPRYGINRTQYTELKNPRWIIFYIDKKLGKRVKITLDGKTGERLREEHHVIRWEENLMGPRPEPIIVFDKLQPEKKSSEIYKTHKGKNYTKPEWEEFEKQQFEDFKKNRDKN